MEKNAKKWEEENAQKNAARMLLCDYVAKNPESIQYALENIIPFFQFDCSISGLKGVLNTVNVTFATVALDVIKSSQLEPDDQGRHFLPVNADDMRSAIYYLSKIIDALEPLAAMIDNNKDLPAFKMTADAFSKEEIYG